MSNASPVQDGPGHFSPHEFAARVRATRAEMASRGLSALVFASPENIYYLTGLDHQGYFAFTLLVLGAEGPPLLVTRAMERATVAAQVPQCEHVTFQDSQDPASAAVEAVRRAAGEKACIGIELGAMYFPPALWDRIRAGLPNAQWTDSAGLVEGLRAVKSPAEIACVRRAAAISDRAMQVAISGVDAGENEKEIAANVYREMIAAGSEPPGFAPLIRSTDILLQEHVGWRDRELSRGEALFMELSASVAHYHAPLTRLVHVGKPPVGTEVAAEIAFAGLEAVRRVLRPGAVARDVYAEWQRVVDKGLGHSRYRRHHCGYMIGIGFPPSWVGGSAVVGLRSDGDLVVREGMVFHLLSWLLGQEPADFVVSDTALVTADGCELLTQTPRGPHVVA